MHIATTKTFDKEFKKQTQKIKEQFAIRIQLLRVDIDHKILHVHKLSGKMQHLWSFNVTGDIRVLFEKNTENSLLLTAIGSHSELYS